VGYSGRAGGASDGDSQEEARSGSSRHVIQHEQSGIDIQGLKPVGSSRRATGANDGDSQEEARIGSDEDEQEEAGSAPNY
jgi:hypothetical protein